MTLATSDHRRGATALARIAQAAASVLASTAWRRPACGLGVASCVSPHLAVRRQ
jgi:hypothetical protein